jgi:hypothetical protein
MRIKGSSLLSKSRPHFQPRRDVFNLHCPAFTDRRDPYALGFCNGPVT